VKQIKWVGNNLWKGLQYAFSRLRGVSGPAPGVAVHDTEVAAVAGAAAILPAETAAAAGVRTTQSAPATLPAHHDDTDIALRLRSLHAGYGEIEVLHGVDLGLKQGTITALLGANGAGKSTLCAVLAGVVPQSSGDLLLRGRDIKKMHPGDRVDAGLFIAPESRGIFPGMTVEDNLRIWLTTNNDLEAAFTRFPALASRRKLDAGSLSGGEQQLLTLAPAFVRLPQVLIADEPTLGLAPLLRTEIMGLCSELCQEGVTVLLIEEKARDVLTIADRVAVLELGRIVWERPRQEVDEDELTRVYLGGTTTFAATSP
jgi:ABC-type branched-subunit amino acid transport system ATPase component